MIKIDNAIKSGIAYLLSINDGGKWKGFSTLAGDSDIWVTGFVLSHIKHLVRQFDSINTSYKFLLDAQKENGGWSYSAQVPADADSTAWCINALGSYNDIDNVIDKAKMFLWNQFNGIGISTYHPDSGILDFISVTDPEIIKGWTAAHPDVSISAMLADPLHESNNEIIRWLFDNKNEAGFINSYWWRGPYYSTALLLRALAKNGLTVPVKWNKKIGEGLIDNRLKEGGYAIFPALSADAFNTALALEASVHLGRVEESLPCCDALLELQLDNGGWAGGYNMRIPAPFVLDPDEVGSWNSANGGGNSLIEDKQGIFATAMACYALDSWKKSVD